VVLAPRRIARLLPVIVLAALALPASAFGQATRTFVSGVGDDVNPCSRTAPCKTFAGALSKTARHGEINCLDPAGYGAVTITKGMTIDCRYTHGSILACGFSGVVINMLDANVGDKVILRGLSINGCRGTTSPGPNGVRIIVAKSVSIQRSSIFGFTQNGVLFQPSNAGARLGVSHSTIENIGGNGVFVAPTSTGTGKATLRHNDIVDNDACGILATTHGATTSFANGRCGSNTAPAQVSQNATINAYNNDVSDNGKGVFSVGASIIRIAENSVTGNGTGLFATAGGQILSWQNNYVTGNTTNGSPTGTLTPSR
jgi:hypothetical protein